MIMWVIAPLDRVAWWVTTPKRLGTTSGIPIGCLKVNQDPICLDNVIFFKHVNGLYVYYSLDIHRIFWF